MAGRADTITVDELRLAGTGRVPVTRIWISEPAAKELREFVSTTQPPKWFLKKLQRYSENGFANYIHAEGAIRPEWGGAYRIGDPKTLFRLIGFFENDRRDSFIVLDAFTKRGHGLSASERQRIDRMVERAAHGLWKKRN